jgi:DNA polymerase I-like protein with 3'-5' exonuclease and polymerase domains
MNVLVFDFETSYKFSKPWHPESYCVSLGIEIMHNTMQTYYQFIINHKDMAPTFDLGLIQELFDNADEIVAHNICFDLHWLRKCGIKLKKSIRLFDTMIAEYLICGQSKKYDALSLADLSDKYLDTPKDDKVKVFWDAGYETDEIPLGVLMPYMKRDVINTRNIYLIQQDIIEAKDMKRLVRLQSELAGVVEEMEWNGMLVDLETCKTKEQDCIQKFQELNLELDMFICDALPELRDIPIKWTSGEHLSVILFGGELTYDGREKTERVLKDGTIKHGERNAKLKIATKGLGFVPGKRTETAKPGFYQTNKAQMDQLKPKGKQQKRFLEILEEISSMEKLSGTYFGPFQTESIGQKFHPQFNQTATVTGRLTCSRLHQIPRDADCGVKGVFISQYPTD